jgi:hypothetical protein
MKMNTPEQFEEATEQVRKDVKRLMDGFDLHAISKSMEDFGRQNPIGLALAALGLGISVGLLMRRIGSFDKPQEK